MMGVKLGSVPVERMLNSCWKAWIPTLEENDYGLMMIFKRKKKKRSIVIKKRFETVERAYQFAYEWLEQHWHEYEN